MLCWHSTVSSAFNSLTAVTMVDLIKPHYSMSESRASLLSKILGETSSCLFISIHILTLECLVSHIWLNDIRLGLPVSMFYNIWLYSHSALSYGIICLAVAYVVHLMNSSVLQVRFCFEYGQYKSFTVCDCIYYILDGKVLRQTLMLAWGSLAW